MKKKIIFEGRTYVLEEQEIPSEFIVFEGVTYKRKEAVSDYQKRVLNEASSGKPAEKIVVNGKVFFLSENQSI